MAHSLNHSLKSELVPILKEVLNEVVNIGMHLDKVFLMCSVLNWCH